MGNYPKNRKKSALVRCEICGKYFTSQGIGTHRRQKHETVLKVISIEKNNSNTTVTPIVTPIVTKAINNSIANLSNVVGKDLTECVRPDGQHFYTEKDLRILCALILHSLRAEPSQIMKVAMKEWDVSSVIGKLVLDFEKRFECKFNDAMVANKHISPFADDNMKITDKYDSLEYSR